MEEASPISASLGAMGSLLRKLTELLATGHRALRGAVMDDIEQLTAELHNLQSLLLKLSDAQQDPPVAAGYWMKEVRELSYDMEDCADRFIHTNARAKIRRAARRRRRKTIITRLKIKHLQERRKPLPWITNKVLEFRTRALEATQRYWRYNFDHCSSGPVYSRVTRAASTEEAAGGHVGLEGPVNELHRWLTNGEEQLRVVTIVGVAGVGKTTLAQKLWGKLQGQFQCRAFVRTAQKPNMRGIISSILSQVRPHQPPDPGDMHHLICDLREFLQDKRTGSSPMAFFVKEVDSPFMCSYSGVRFNSDASMFVHVSVYQQEHWSRFVSEPLVPPPLATFQRTPYCVLVGKKLYMMYLVGFILCFDLDAKEFSVIGLPGDMPNTARSWFDYTVSKGATGGLCLVHFHDNVIDRWVLVDQPAGVNWELDTTFNLVPAFGAIVQNLFCGVQLIDVTIDWGSVQLRSASQGCRYVFISVGVNAGLFIADMLGKTLQVVPNIAHDGSLGRVFKLEETWPPKI